MIKRRLNSTTLSLIYISLIVFWQCFIVPFASAAASENNAHNPCELTPESTDQWYDLSHAYLSKKFCEPAVAFDNFFGDDRNLEERSGTYARWRNDIVWDESDRLAFHTELRAKVRLPKINKRLKLIVTSDHDDDFASPLTNADAATSTDTLQTASQQPEQRRISDSTIGLQYDINSKPKYTTSFNVGLRTHIPLQLHSNFRYRYIYPFANNYLFRFTETLFWRKWEGFGETSRFDLEKLINPSTLARASMSKTFSEITEGIEWGANAGIFYKVSQRAGLNLDLVTSGSTRPNSVITNYGLVAKYRRNFYRKWLFFEVIPEINWPRDDNDHYGGQNTLTFRLDVQFWQH